MVGNNHLAEGILERQDLLSAKALFNAGKEAIVHILPNSAQTFPVIAFIEWNIPSQSDRLQCPAEANQRQIDEPHNHP